MTDTTQAIDTGAPESFDDHDTLHDVAPIEAQDDFQPEAETEAVAPMPVVVPDTDFADDPAVRSSIGTFLALGLPLNSRELYAAEDGNFTYLEDWADGLRGKRGEQAQLAVALLKQAHERFLKADEVRESEILATIEKAAGGKQEWAEIRAWADQNSTQEERAEIQAALSHGGITAKMAVLAMKAMHALQGAAPAEKDDGTPSDRIVRQSAARQAPGSHVSAAWYADQIEALSRKYGTNMTNTREFAQVSAAWAAHKDRVSR